MRAEGNSAPLAPPTAVGPYRLGRRLGTGGMGAVFEAERASDGSRVAVKLLHAHLMESEQARQRFVREGRAAARVVHPHVVSVLDVGESDGVPFLAMELLEGGPLADRIHPDRPLPEAEVAALLVPVIAAVRAAHAAGVVHRDLKPHNIILARDAEGGVRPKVVDFGISRVLDAAERLTKTEGMLGSVHYIAPEQARSPKSADARSDQYSLGVILYQCATGTLPFGGESPYDVLHAVMTSPVPSPRRRVPSLSATFDDLVTRALAKDPRDRYASLGGLGAALLASATPEVHARWRPEFGAAVEGPARAAPTPAPFATLADEAVRPPSRARRRIGLAAAATAVGAAVAAAGVMLAPREPEPAPVAPRRDPTAAVLAPTARAQPVTSTRAVPRAAEEAARRGPEPTPRTTAPSQRPEPTRSTRKPEPARPGSSVGASPSVGDNGALILE